MTTHTNKRLRRSSTYGLVGLYFANSTQDQEQRLACFLFFYQKGKKKALPILAEYKTANNFCFANAWCKHTQLYFEIPL